MLIPCYLLMYLIYMIQFTQPANRGSLRSLLINLMTSCSKTVWSVHIYAGSWYLWFWSMNNAVSWQVGKNTPFFSHYDINYDMSNIQNYNITIVVLVMPCQHEPLSTILATDLHLSTETQRYELKHNYKHCCPFICLHVLLHHLWWKQNARRH